MPSHTLESPNPTATANVPAADDYLTYLDTLRDLGNQGAAVNTALLEAHTADTAPARREALTQLHARLRIMAATANQALGTWPDQDGPRP